MIRFPSSSEVDRSRTAPELRASLRDSTRRLQLYLSAYEDRYGDDLDAETRFMLEEARQSADQLDALFDPDSGQPAP